MSQRTEKIDELLRQEIGEIISREIADPRVGFVTVTEVETAADLGHAKVWVSIIGQPAERAEAFAALGRAMPFVRHQLGSRIRLRRIPDLHLRLDDSTERGTRVLQLLSELEAGALEAPPASTGETLPTPMKRLPHEGDAPVDPEAIPPAAATKPRRRSGGARPAGPSRDGKGRTSAGRGRPDPGRGGRPRGGRP